MNMALERPNLISLAAGFTDHATLPVHETRRIINDLLRDPKGAASALQYGAATGDAQLRDWTARRVAQQDGCSARTRYPTSNLLISHGSQQLLYLLVEALCDPGDIVLVEDPTYFVFLGILSSHKVQCRGLPLEADGVRVSALEEALALLKRSGELKRVKLLYLVSYFQNPTAITTSLEKKQATLDCLRSYERWAGHPLYLLEDAAYRDLRFAGPEIPSLLSVERNHDRVLYAGTYSKPFATGIRVGFSWLPEPIFTAVLRIKGNHDFGTSNLLQQVLVQALREGWYDQHLPVIQQAYARKAEAMAAGLEHHFADTHWIRPRGGLCTWLELPKAIRTGVRSRFFQKALARDVLYLPGEFCFAPDPLRPIPRNAMRLSFGSAEEADITEALDRLGQIYRRCR